MEFFKKWREKYSGPARDSKFEVISEDGEVLTFTDLDRMGSEILDPTPMDPPIGFDAQQGDRLAELIHSMVHGALRQQLADEDLETIEESEDFDMDDSEDIPFTRHEIEALDEFVEQKQELIAKHKRGEGVEPLPVPAEPATPGEAPLPANDGNPE